MNPDLDIYQLIHDLLPQQQGIIVRGYSETNGLKETLRLKTKACLTKQYLLRTSTTAPRRVLP